MANQNNAIQEHLARFIEDMMQQKFRLDITKQEYQEMLYKIKERIIDQTTFINNLETEDVADFVERKKFDEDHQIRMQNIIDEKDALLNAIYKDIHAHLIELSNIELERAGFITHIVTCDEQTRFDKESKVMTFSEKGHAEIPIATILRKWTDASQIRIIPVENKS